MVRRKDIEKRRRMWRRKRWGGVEKWGEEGIKVKAPAVLSFLRRKKIKLK